MSTACSGEHERFHTAQEKGIWVFVDSNSWAGRNGGTVEKKKVQMFWFFFVHMLWFSIGWDVTFATFSPEFKM